TLRRPASTRARRSVRGSPAKMAWTLLYPPRLRGVRADRRAIIAAAGRFAGFPRRRAEVAARDVRGRPPMTLEVAVDVVDPVLPARRHHEGGRNLPVAAPILALGVKNAPRDPHVAARLGVRPVRQRPTHVAMERPIHIRDIAKGHAARGHERRS